MGWNECHDLGVETSGIYIHPQDTDSGNHYVDNIKIHDNLTYNMTHSGIILNLGILMSIFIIIYYIIVD